MRDIMKKFFSILLSFILVISLAVLTITISIGLPIYIRDFYFAFVKITDLPTISGYSFEVIETAFNELMDFLILNKEFSTGALKFSEEGKNHFIDVKFLFDLNFYGLIISLCDFIINFEGEIPGATPIECGNYSEQNLSMAKYYINKYKKELIENKRFIYSK
jgi:uncharacterized membrane protein